MKRVLCFIVAMFVAVPVIQAAELYKTRDELFEAIPIVKPYQRYTIYSLLVPDLTPGDLVVVDCQVEATNDYDHQVMFSHALMVHNKEVICRGRLEFPRRSDKYWWSWVRPAIPSGENITHETHHTIRNIGGSFEAEEYGDHWVSLIVHASSTASIPGDELTINFHNGGITAVVIRN
jgi:hypothetical protein